MSEIGSALMDMRIAWIYRLLVLAFGVSIAVPCDAQLLPGRQNLSSDAVQAPLCNPDMIDETFTFANLPAGEETVSLHFANMSNAACRLEGRAAPSFAVDSHSMYVDICWLCREDGTGSPNPQREPADQILLAPGKWATLDEHWATTGESCQWADWINFGVGWAKPTGYLFIPSEWPLHICSAAKSSGYRAGQDSATTGAARDGDLRVSVTPQVIYSDEVATLHVELARQADAAAGCASLYTVRRGAESVTRLDPLFVSGMHAIASYTPQQVEEDQKRAWPQWKRDRLRRCDIEPRKTSVDAGISAADLAGVTHIEWRTAAAPDKEPSFLTVNTHFVVLDVNTLAPNWGETVGGIRAGLSVDRESFSVGEWVPIHVLWENVNATKGLGQEECGPPMPALEIQDSQHHVIETVPLSYSGCSGHGWGPIAIRQGAEQRMLWQLGTVPGSVPLYGMPGEAKLTVPGVYYLVTVWSPVLLEPYPKPDSSETMTMGRGRLGAVYATARSMPVRVEITATASAP